MKRKSQMASFFIAILALVAITVPAAQAAPEFQAVGSVEGQTSVVPATVKGAQVEGKAMKFTFGSWSTTCTTATATGSLETGASTTLTMVPSYSGCTTAGFATEINVGSCAFVFHTTSEIETDGFSTDTDIACGAGSLIKMTVKVFGITSCIIKVEPQTGLKSTRVQNMTEASPIDATGIAELEGVKFTVENGAISCAMTPGSYTGKATGTTTLTAKDKAEKEIEFGVNLLLKFHFALGAEEEFITGTKDTNQIFVFDFAKIECEKNDATLFVMDKNKTTASLPALFHLENCFIGLTPITMKDNCRYNLDPTTEQKGVFEGVASVYCPFGGENEFKATECTIKVPAQSGPKKTGLNKVTFKNIGAGKTAEVTAELNLTGLNYTEEGNKCINSGVPKTNGTQTGAIKYLGEETKPGGTRLSLTAAVTKP